MQCLFLGEVKYSAFYQHLSQNIWLNVTSGASIVAFVKKTVKYHDKANHE